MTYIDNISYFEVAPPGHTIAYENVGNLLKNGKCIFSFVMLPKNMMFNKCSNLKGFKFYTFFITPRICGNKHF